MIYFNSLDLFSFKTWCSQVQNQQVHRSPSPWPNAQPEQQLTQPQLTQPLPTQPQPTQPQEMQQQPQPQQTQVNTPPHCLLLHVHPSDNAL